MHFAAQFSNPLGTGTGAGLSLCLYGAVTMAGRCLRHVDIHIRVKIKF